MQKPWTENVLWNIDYAVGESSWDVAVDNYNVEICKTLRSYDIFTGVLEIEDVEDAFDFGQCYEIQQIMKEMLAKQRKKYEQVRV
jgi:hypothetical protein